MSRMSSRKSLTMSVKQAKRQLRAIVRKQLCHLAPESIEVQSDRVFNTVIRTPQFKNARRIGLYMNMPHLEIRTNDLIRHCYTLKKEVFLPKCVSNSTSGRKMNHLIMLQVPTYHDIEQLRPQGKYNLLEPVEGLDLMSSSTGDGLDLLILPGVAFTKVKERLGHGGGFYDEFLKAYSQKFEYMPHLMGIGLKEQLVSDIPKEEHDWNLDLLVVDGILY